MSDLQECIYLSWHESVKIKQYVGIKYGKDVANEIKHSKTETAVTQLEGTAVWPEVGDGVLTNKIAAK
jgi:hypothetical protein